MESKSLFQIYEVSMFPGYECQIVTSTSMVQGDKVSIF